MYLSGMMYDDRRKFVEMDTDLDFFSKFMVEYLMVNTPEGIDSEKAKDILEKCSELRVLLEEFAGV
jgi:hypothetical protein